MMNNSTIVAEAPGRINLIGEHTDYNDGFVLPAAIDKKTVVTIKRTAEKSICRIVARNFNETLAFDLQDLKHSEIRWLNYIIGVVSELQLLGAQISGFDCHIEGDVPIGSGMSSSASLECGLAFGLNKLFDCKLTKIQLIKAAQNAEHNYVGIKCGIMDQFASVMGKKKCFMLLDCRSLDYEHIPFKTDDYSILLMNSNVSHELATSEYNTRREECELGLQIVQSKYSYVSSLRDITNELLEKCRNDMPNVIYRRCRHVVNENERVLLTVTALKQNNFALVGHHLKASHHSLRTDYEVSCSELDFLNKLASTKSYVLGSRMMGGGFGGCTINLIKKDFKEQFINEISQAFMKKYQHEPTPYSVKTCNGAQLISS